MASLPITAVLPHHFLNLFRSRGYYRGNHGITAVAGLLCHSLVWADTAKFTDVMIVARLRKCSDLVREGKVFVQNKTKVASGVSCSERAVLYFRVLLIKSNKKKFSFRRVESELQSSGKMSFPHFRRAFCK